VPSPPPCPGGTFYFWHTKFNRQGTRVMQVLRYLHPAVPAERNPMVFTFTPRGPRSTSSNRSHRSLGCRSGAPPAAIRTGIRTGPHPAAPAHPGRARPSYWLFRYDGAEAHPLSQTLRGVGHPSLEPQGRYLVTDRHVRKGGRPAVEICLVDLVREEETVLCRIPTIAASTYSDPVFRLDGHPVWSRDYRKVLFQAAPDGRRQLFLADLSALLPA